MNSQDSTSHTASSGKHVSFGPFCPYVAYPFPDCYCFKMTSQKVSLVLAYCGDDFENCEIYRCGMFSGTTK